VNPLKADKLERSLRLANNNAKENDDLDDIDDILHGMFIFIIIIICIECMDLSRFISHSLYGIVVFKFSLFKSNLLFDIKFDFYFSFDMILLVIQSF
jgi:hypothetical protein